MKKTIATTLMATMALTACGETTGVDGAIDDTATDAIDGAENLTGTTISGDTAEAVAKLQTSLDVLAAEVEDIDAPADLQAAWAELEARATDATLSAQIDADIDASDLEAAVDEFDERLEDVEPTPVLEQAWAEFRSALDTLIASI